MYRWHKRPASLNKINVIETHFIVHFVTFYFVIALVLKILIGCDSKATVQWENKDRSAMQKKIGETISNPEVSTTYKNLTAGLTEDERQLVNTLVSIVLERTPSSSDKAKTLSATFKAISSIRNESSIRALLPDALQTMTVIAKATDSSLLGIMDAISASRAENRINIIKQTQSIVEFASKNERLKDILENLVPKSPSENLVEIIQHWNSLPSDSGQKINYLSTELNLAGVIGVLDFAQLLQNLSMTGVRDFYLAIVSKISTNDLNASLFVKLVNKIPTETLEDFSILIDRYHSPNLDPETLKYLLEVFKKTLPLKETLVGPFFSITKEILASNDASVYLSGMLSSIDNMKGEGFYVKVLLANKRVTNKEPLTCTIQGHSTDKVSYSFYWTKNNLTLIDWTAPSSNKNHTSQKFNLGDQTQCFVRIYIEDKKIAELTGDLITVRSAPPEFVSGEEPTIDSTSMLQGRSLDYTAELATDPNEGDLIYYQISEQSKQGSVTQSGLSAFKYTPILSFYGEDEFKYRACDQNGFCSNEKLVKISIEKANFQPLIHGISGPSQIVNTATNTITLNEDITALTTPVILIAGEDDEVNLGACSAAYTITSSDQTILKNSPSTIEISGLFPFCTMKIVPEANKYGSITLTASLTDFVNTPTVKTFSVNIINSNDPPSIIGQSITGTPSEDSPFILTITGSDVDNNLSCSSNLSYISQTESIIAATGAATFGGTWPNCEITFTPKANANGPSTVLIKLKDTENIETSAIFSFFLNAIDDTPVLQTTGITTINLSQQSPATTILITDLATASDLDGGGRTVIPVLVTAPTMGSLSVSTGAQITSDLTYTPSGMLFGTDYFEYRLCDSIEYRLPLSTALNTACYPSLNSPPIRINITLLSKTPVVVSSGMTGTIQINEDSGVTHITLDSATDPDGTMLGQNLSYVLVASTMNKGTLGSMPTNVPMTGTAQVSYSPILNLNHPGSESDSFEYKICDNKTPIPNCTSSKTIHIRVLPVNDSPSQVDPGTTTIPEILRIHTDESNSPVITSQQINLAKFIDPDILSDGQTVRPYLISAPLNGTLFPNLNNASPLSRPDLGAALSATTTYTPNPNFVGMDSFTYRACDYPNLAASDLDKITCSDLITVRIEVSDVPIPIYKPVGWIFPFSPAPIRSANHPSIAEDSQYEIQLATLNPDTISPGQLIVYKITTPSLPIAGRYVLNDISNPSKTLGSISASLPGVSPGQPGKIIFVPEANAHGSTKFNYKICYGNSSSDCLDEIEVNLNILNVSDAPVLIPPAALMVDENATTPLTFTFQVSDPDGDVECANVLPTSNNTSLVQNLPGKLSVGAATFPNCTLNVTPEANSNGWVTIALTATDTELNSVSKNFDIFIRALNSSPTVSKPADVTINENTTHPAISSNFTISDADGTARCSQVVLVTDAPQIFPIGSYTISLQSSAADGKSQTCALQMTPALNQHGSAQVDLILNDGDLIGSTFFNVTVTPVNDSPIISAISDLTLYEDGVSDPINFSVSDIEQNVSCSMVTKTSSNNAIINSTSDILIVGTTQKYCALRIKPTANTFTSGTPVTITLSLDDQASTNPITFQRQFNVSVIAQNDPPTMSVMNDLLLNEDNVGSATFSVNDVDNPSLGCADVAFSVPAAQTSPSFIDNLLLPQTNISISNISGNPKSCLITVTPVPNRNGGPVPVTLNLSDGLSSTIQVIKVFVASEADTPIIITTGSSPLAAENAGTTAESINYTHTQSLLTISEDETPTNTNIGLVRADDSDLSTISNSSQQNLYYLLVRAPAKGTLSSGIVLGYMNVSENPTPTSSANIKYTPSANANGADHFVYKVCDSHGIMTCSGNILVEISITPVNDAPQLTSQNVFTQTIREDHPSNQINLATATHPDSLPMFYVISAGENPNHHNGGFALPSNYSATGSVNFTPESNFSGSDRFRYKICDGRTPTPACSAEVTVDINIYAVNDAPVIGDVSVPSPGTTALNDSDSPWNINERNPMSGSEPLLRFNLTDVEDNVNCSSVVANSSNSLLIPSSNIIVSGTAPNCTVQATPIDYANGNTFITLSFTDSGSLTSFTRFKINAAAIDNPAQISPIQNQTINENTATEALAFSISDIDSAVNCSSVQKTSSNPVLITADDISISGGALQICSVKVTPEVNKNGSALITLSLGSTNQTFTVNVIGQDSAPTISTVTRNSITYSLANPWTTNERNNLSSAENTLSFDVDDVDTLNLACIPSAGILGITAESSRTDLVPNANIEITGAGKACSIRLTPIAEANGGPIVITLRLSDGVTETLRQFNMMITPQNNIPAIDPSGSIPFASQTTPGDTNGISHNHQHASLVLNEDTIPISNNITLVKGIDPDTQTLLNLMPQQLNYFLVAAPTLGTLSSGNTPGFMNLPESSSPLLGTGIKYTPNTNVSGSDYMIYKICDSFVPFTCTNNIKVPISIVAVDEDPTLTSSATSSYVILEDSTALTIPLATATHPDGLPLFYQMVTGKSPQYAKTAITFPLGYLANGNVSYTPADHFFGSDEFSYQICDNRSPPRCTAEVNVEFTVVGVNDSPTLGSVTSPSSVALDVSTNTWNISERNPSSGIEPTLSFTLSDIEDTSLNCGNVSATSSLSTLIPNENLVVNGAAPNCTIKVTPLNYQNGESIITLTFTDSASLTTTKKFKTIVSSVDNPSVISVISDQTIYQNTSTTEIAFSVSDLDTAVACQDVGKSSNNSSLVSSSTGIVISGGTGTTCSIKVTPNNNTNGTATITLSLNSIQRTFNVMVNPINNSPTISTISNSSINYDLANVWTISERTPSSAAEPALSFTIGDGDSNVDCIGTNGYHQVYATSSDTSILPNANVIIGGTGNNCTITATPINFANGGPIAITLTLSDGTSTATRQFNIKINPSNTIPTIDVTDSNPLASASSGTIGGINYSHTHSALIINEDSNPSSNNITLVKGVDPDTSSTLNLAPQQLVYMLVSAPTRGILSTGSLPGFMNLPSGTNPTLGTSIKYIPNANENGSDYFIYKICDSHSTIACTDNIRSDISITAADDAPMLTSASSISVTTSEDSVATNITLATATSADNRALSYTVVTQTVNHKTLIAFPANYSTNATISYIPADNFSGSDQIVYKICDDRPTPLCSANVTINFNITAVNDPVTLGAVTTPGNVALNETTSSWNISERNLSSAAEPELAFTLTDLEDTESCSNVVAFASNSLLLPNTGIGISGTAPNCKVTVTPVNDASGTTIVTLQYTDSGLLTSSQKFKVVVIAVDNPPIFSAISSQTIYENESTTELAFTLTDVDSVVQCSEIVVVSSNTILIPSANISISGGSGNICSSKVTPLANKNGNSLITLSHGTASTSFTVNVTSVNTSPSISAVSQSGTTYTTTQVLTINERKPGDPSEPDLSFTIDDVDSNVECMGLSGAAAVSASSSNLNLIPNANIAIGGSGLSCTVKVTPVDYVNGGPVTITLTLNDGSHTATRQFNVIITPVNNIPTIDVAGSGPLATLVSPQGNDNGVTFDYLQSLTIVEDASAQNITLVKANDFDTSATLNLSPQKLNYILVTPPTKGLLNAGNSPGFMNFTETTSASLGASLSYLVNTDQFGSDHFVYKICDSNTTTACTANVKVSITITGVNESPLLTSQTSSTKVILEDASSSTITLATATSPDGLPLVYFEVPGKGPTNAKFANSYPAEYATNGVVTYTPSDNYSGTDQFVYQICDNRAVPLCTPEITVNVLILSVNDAPVIGSVTTNALTVLNSSTSPWTTTERNPTSTSEAQHTFTITDAEDSGIACSSVVAISSNSTLIPNSSITISGTAPNCNIRVTPVDYGNGDSDITLYLRDSEGLATLQSFRVVVNAVDNSAVISTITNQTVNQNTSTQNLAFAISDRDTSVTCADVSVASSNLALFPLANVTVAGGSGTVCSITAVPALNQVGTSSITLSLGSGGTQTSMSFNVTVNATPSSPSIGQVSYSGTFYDLATPWEINERASGSAAEPSLTFTIGDPDSLVDCVGSGGANQVTVSSSNTSLIPNSSVVIGGTGTNCTVTVTPIINGNGWPTVITLSLSDGTNTVSRQFAVKVNPVNSAPAIDVSGSSPLATVQSGMLGGVSYTHEQSLSITEDNGSTSITLVNGSDPDTSTILNVNPQQLYYLLVSLPTKGSLSTGNQLGYMNHSEGTSPISGASLTYTPFAHQTGTDSFLYKICDSASPISCSSAIKVNISINPLDDAPILTSSNSSSLVIVEDAAASQVSLATATSNDARPMVYTLTTAPSNASGALSFPASYSATGTVAYTPAANFSGSDLFKYKICDDRSPALCTSEVTVNITVIAANDGPVLGAVTSPAPSSSALNETSSPWTISERAPGSATEPLLTFNIQDIEDTGLACNSVLALSSNATLIPTSNLVIGGTAPNCTLTATPLNYENGQSVITLILTDNGTMTSLQKFKIIVSAVNNDPTISAIAHQTINENSATEAIAFNISDIDSSVNCNGVTASSSNTTLLPVSNITLAGGTGTICSVKATPVTNQNGTSNVTLTLGAVTTTFQLTVTAQNSAPTISTITYSGTEYSLTSVWSRNERAVGDAAEPALSFTISDPDSSIDCVGAAGASLVTTSSSNTALIPNSSVVIGGTGTNCTVTVTPANNANGGPVVITLSLSDGALTATRQFAVMVNAVNSAPAIDVTGSNPLAGANAGSAGGFAFTHEQNISVTEDSFANNISLVKALDPDTSTALNVAAQQLYYLLVLAPTKGTLSTGTQTGYMNFSEAVSAASGATLTYTPQANQTGLDYFLYKICDSANPITCSTLVKAAITISTVDDAPILTSSNSSSLVIVEDAAASQVSLATATSNDARPMVYTLTTAPSNASGALSFPASYSATGTVAYTPAANFSGSDLFKYKICDDRSPALCTSEVTVNITVIAANDGPVLGAVTSPAPSSSALNETSSPWTISERAPGSATEPLLTFNIQDIEDTGLACNSVLALSSNATLIPTSNLVIGGTAPNCTLTATPLNYENGQSVITLILTDNGTMTSLQKFKIIVSAVNNDPTISAIAHQTINENSATEAIAFNISDIDSSVNCNGVTASSSNTTLLPVSNITLAGGTGTICSVKATPVTNQNGTSNVTLTLGAVTTTFQLTVTAQNSAPTISTITYSGTEYSLTSIWTRNERAVGDAAEPALSFTIDDPDDTVNCTGSGGAYGISKTTSNSGLIPTTNIVIAGANKSCTVTVTPENGVNGGPVTITLQLSDGTFTSTRQFNVMINPYNNLPTIPLDVENISLLKTNPPVSGIKNGISYTYEQEVNPLFTGSNDVTLLKATDADVTQVNNTAYQNLVYVLVKAPATGSLSVGSSAGLMNLPASTDPTTIGTIITYNAPNPTVTTYFIYKICESGSNTRCTPNILVHLTP